MHEVVEGWCIILLGLLCLPATAITTNDVGYLRLTFFNTGEGNGSGKVGQQDWRELQINDMVASAQAWANILGNTAGRMVDVHCFWTNFSGAILGGASSPYVGNYVTAQTYTEYVWRSGVNYTRPGGSYADVTITYDIDAAGYAWNFGSDAPTGSEIDFRSVVTHELGHAVGFVSTYSSSSDKWWLGGITLWDSWLRDDAGNAPLANTTGTPGNFNQLDNPIWFTGPNAVAANGGANVPVYAPATYAAGSSLTHLNESSYPSTLMTPSIGLGEMVRTISAVEQGVLLDLGWNVIPEPATVSLCVLLLGGTIAARRLRRVVHNPPVPRA
jgi:hypothetical protein